MFINSLVHLIWHFANANKYDKYIYTRSYRRSFFTHCGVSMAKIAVPCTLQLHYNILQVGGGT